MRYRWQPLNEERQEIRLLDLKAGAEDSFLSGTLRHVFLDDPVKPRYETISYAWGESALVESILVDEKSISIPASAAAALRCMRLPQCDRTLWIDCICINQDNHDEKSHQVGMMAKVFTSSVGTLAFLGDDDDNTAAHAFQSFTYLSDALKRAHGDKRSILTSTGMNITQQARDSLHWTAMQDILSRPYFERLWIVQEATLSRGTTFFCGKSRYDFHDLVVVVRWLRATSELSESPSLRGHFPAMEFLSMAAVVLELARIGMKSMAFGHTLAFLLAMSDRLRFSEPRDRVFGLIGLLRLVAPQRSFHVDYTDPVADVYCDATRECTKTYEGFWTLEVCGYARPSDVGFADIPSWVPSWFCQASARVNTTISALPYQDNLWSHSVPRYNVEPEMLPEIIIKNKRKLGIRAKLLETIHRDSSGVLTLKDSLAPNGKAHDFLRIAHDLLPDCTAGADRESWRRVNDVLTAGSGGAPLVELSQDCEQELARSSRTERSQPVATEKSQPWTAFKYCLGRKVFITHSGRLGIGPDTLKSGDHVVISKLSKWPMILRREQSPDCDEFTVVGAAYVEGIKDGDPLWKAAELSGSIRTIYLV